MSNFAIFQTGGKQYRVTVGDVVKVEKLNADGKVEFKKSELNESQLKSNEKWHVQINGADAYAYEDLYLDGYGEYTIVLTAKN